MRENFDSRQLVDKATLHRLMKKSDRPAMLKIVLHFSLWPACLILLAWVPMAWYLLVPVLLFFGFVAFSLYAPLHETTHKTAFESNRLNSIWAWITGVLYGYSPGMHTSFHFEHHRRTNEEDDPERGFSLPPMPGRTLLMVLAIGLLGMLPPIHSLVLGLTPTRYWDKLAASWTPVRRRKVLAWECRIITVCWSAGLVWLALHPPLLWYVILAWFQGRLLHAAVSFTEHDGLSADGDQIDRTRTVTTNRIFRWLWWNMNYHAEHHMWPAVPYHQLPELHQLIREKRSFTENSYIGFLLGVRYR